MSGIYYLEITESEEELKCLLQQQKAPRTETEFICFNCCKADERQRCRKRRPWLGRHRVTVQKWAKCVAPFK